MVTENDPVEELSTEENWALLERGELGRIAYLLVDEVHLVPVNYVVDDGCLLVRTSPGNRLLAAALEAGVAFEIDGRDGNVAWSVVARGRLRRLEEDEQHRMDDHPERPWVAVSRPEVVELRPEVVTGRRFLLRSGV